MYRVKIRVAGNTATPCMKTIESKGFKVTMATYILNENFSEVNHDYFAEKENLYFSATNLEELLGLISMWECRGDNWRATHDEIKDYQQLKYNSPTFDDDGTELDLEDECELP